MIDKLFFILILLIKPEPHSSSHKCETDLDCNPFYECISEGYAVKSARVRKRTKLCAPRNLPEIQSEGPNIIKHIVKMCGGSNRLANMLVKVGKRESNYKFWVSHWMPSDVRAGQIALMRNAWRYKDNEFIADSDRWQTLGYFGLTSANFLFHYSPIADPLDLSNPIVSVHVWLRAAAGAHRKLRRGVMCDKIGLYKPKKITYADIHRAVNGGSLCPRKGAKHEWMKRNMPSAFKYSYSAKDLKASCFSDDDFP